MWPDQPPEPRTILCSPCGVLAGIRALSLDKGSAQGHRVMLRACLFHPRGRPARGSKPQFPCWESVPATGCSSLGCWGRAGMGGPSLAGLTPLRLPRWSLHQGCSHGRTTGGQAVGAGTCLLCPWRGLHGSPSHPDLLTFLLLRLILEFSHFTRSQLPSRQHVLGVGLCVQKAWPPRSSSAHQPRCAPAASLPGEARCALWWSQGALRGALREVLEQSPSEPRCNSDNPVKILDAINR